jgi:hypothetical protein
MRRHGRTRFAGTWLTLALLGGCGDDVAGDGSSDAAGASGVGGAAAAADGSAGVGGAAGSGGAAGGPPTYGELHSGGEFHLGPVDWAETQWHNACAPGGGYQSMVRDAESPGELLAGLSRIPDVAGDCDACILVHTAMGKNALLRVVTYGDTTENSIDVSPAAYELLDSGEYPRHMTWQLAKCAEEGPVLYEFQTGANEYWTSLWVRAARLPLTKVEVQSANHADFVQLERGSDGTLTDAGGFGVGPFTLRLTAVDGSTRTDNFEWPADGVGGALLSGAGNFD